MDRPVREGQRIALAGIRLAGGGRQLLDGLSLALHPGRRTVILGPNGAGKSLTLRILQGLIAPDAGEIDWGAAPPRRALVTQEPVLLDRSVEATLAHALRIYGLPRRERAARIADLLALADLAHLARSPARVLSGGERQRLAIARALGADPGLMMLDEPTASLDPAATLRIEALIHAAHARGTRILMVTHDLGQARRIADRVVFLHRGRVLEEAEAGAFFERPATREARAYLAGHLVL